MVNAVFHKDRNIDDDNRATTAFPLCFHFPFLRHWRGGIASGIGRGRSQNFHHCMLRTKKQSPKTHHVSETARWRRAGRNCRTRYRIARIIFDTQALSRNPPRMLTMAFHMLKTHTWPLWIRSISPIFFKHSADEIAVCLTTSHNVQGRLLKKTYSLLTGFLISTLFLYIVIFRHCNST